MYARNARIKIPVIGKAIGFDLIEGDWIQPYGKGKSADFLFQAQINWESRKNFDCALQLTCEEPDNGLLLVTFHLDRIAHFVYPPRLLQMDMSLSCQGISAIRPLKAGKRIKLRMRTTIFEFGLH